MVHSAITACDGITLSSQLFLCSTDLRVQVTDLRFQLLDLPLKLSLLSSLTLAISLLQLRMQKHQQVKTHFILSVGFLVNITTQHCALEPDQYGILETDIIPILEGKNSSITDVAAGIMNF